MNVLITGISGFVGPYLAELLLEHRNVVYGTYLFPEELKRISSLRKRVHLLQCDITRLNELEAIFTHQSFDAIFHLAAQSSVHRSFQVPQQTFEINLIGTINLLEMMRATSSGARLLFASSADVYGEINRHQLPLVESTATNPTNPYAISKAAAEMICLQYARSYQIPILVTRAFSHTGPGQTTQFVIPSFARQIALIETGKAERKIRVGNLTPRRDFLDVRDVVKAYFLLMQTGIPGEIYNIASGNPISIETILHQLLALSKLDVKIEVDSTRFRPNDIPVLSGDTEKLRRITGWKPEIPFQQTLKDVLQFWRAEVKR